MPIKDPDARRAYQLRWIQKRRSDWIESQGGKCALCGSDDELEVDHADPTMKSMEPSAIWSRREDVRLLELAKCQVLCGPCHLAKTHVDREPLHGTHDRYSSSMYNCRCAPCTEAHKLKAREYREAGKKW